MIRATDKWADASEYERYIGRWSRLVARQFLAWLEVPWRRRWLDVGCGPGALSQIILSRVQPYELLGLDRSLPYVSSAARTNRDPRALFAVGDARSLPVADARFDTAVSALVINFVSDPHKAILEMVRSIQPGGTVALYVWDYAERMEMIRFFWDAAVAQDSGAKEKDEARRFPICRPEPLHDLFTRAKLENVETHAIDVPTEFNDFEDFWTPFLIGDAPAPGYCRSLDERRRVRLREALRARLPILPDGTISLIARAWAVRGVKSGG